MIATLKTLKIGTVQFVIQGTFCKGSNLYTPCRATSDTQCDGPAKTDLFEMAIDVFEHDFVGRFVTRERLKQIHPPVRGEVYILSKRHVVQPVRFDVVLEVIECLQLAYGPQLLGDQARTRPNPQTEHYGWNTGHNPKRTHEVPPAVLWSERNQFDVVFQFAVDRPVGKTRPSLRDRPAGTGVV